MSAFLSIWLPTTSATAVVLALKAFNELDSARPIAKLLGVEFASLAAWFFYWMVLYPTYFSPFHNLPTPSRRHFLYGNRKSLFPALPWDELQTTIREVPNDGLIQYFMSFSREMLLVTSTDALKEMFGMRAYDYAHPKKITWLVSGLTGSRLAFCKGNPHKLFRRTLRPAFTVPQVKKVMPDIWAKVDSMVDMMSDEVRTRGEDAVINLRDYMRRAMWDNLGIIVVGRDFNTLKHPNGPSEALCRLLIDARAPGWVGVLMDFVDIRPLLKVLGVLFSQSAAARAMRYTKGLVAEAVKEKEERLKENKDVGHDITSVSLATGVFPASEIEDHGIFTLAVGPNSTVLTFEWAIYELGRNSEIQKRLRAEIHECLGPSEAPAATKGPELQALPYLNAVCNEVFRYYPFLPLMPRVAEVDTTLVGVRIPKGTQLIVPVDAFHRDPALWGPDADEFNPDRWLKDGPEGPGLGGATSPYAMMAFGAGPWGCIGQHYARAILASLLAAVMRRFDVDVVNVETAGRFQPSAPFKKSAEGMKTKLRRL
jgi:cytochrome P450